MAIKAIQQIMLGTVTKNEKQALEILKTIKAAGYDGIELNGFMIRPTSFMVRMMTKMAGMPVGKGGDFDWKGMTEQAGLSVVSVHEDLGTIQREPENVIAEAKKFGTDKVVITGMYRFDYSDKDAVLKLANDLNKAGENLKKSGVQLLYHNHNCEFRKVEAGMTAYDLLIEATNPEYVAFELDSYWATEAGVSAIQLMKQLGNRMKLYHINDRGTRIEGPSMTPILKSDSMELGCGNMNLRELVEQALSVHVDAIILESHKNWVEKSPIKSLQVSAEFMNAQVH
ncbi:MAG: sugar phosphate isomerase/epimerase [Clostridiales bacterium]|nr:sugar phosphate isomerase/epimerase [Roseburia sp.]MDD7636816.1 sugar phosphate isomerase/epimerase [Clostridiales bacterium]MDY4113110.1 sugar phosphate isomerase/epimerase [Roseburia sp.]